MAKPTREVRVFYSWQSDLPEDCNKNGIRNALRAAAKRIEKAMPGLKIVVDEATKRTAGSPNIAAKILEKISAADMMVADISTVSHGTPAGPLPNANVVFELGYGVAELGWERIVLLFNKEFGAFPADMPFDFIQNRASPYALKTSASKAARAELDKLAEDAIIAIIKIDPKRPAALKGLDPQKIKHQRDVETMRWLMSAIHLPTLDDHINELPKLITSRAIWFFENVRGVIDNSLFTLHDQTLSVSVDRFFRAWITAISHDEYYHLSPGGHQNIFTNPGDMPLTGNKDEAWQEIDAQRPIMRRSLDEILARLKSDYLEIDIQETNKAAWEEYRNFKREHEDPFLEAKK